MVIAEKVFNLPHHGLLDITQRTIYAFLEAYQLNKVMT